MSTIQAEQLLEWLLNEEDCECDDHRFYCSYLISHSSLTIAEAADDQSFFQAMKTSLVQALEQDTLSDQDKAGIDALWRQACDLQAYPQI